MKGPNLFRVIELRASDILSNCYEDFENETGLALNKDQPPKRLVVLRHPCCQETYLNPVWQAFYNLDKRGTGTVLLGRLLSLTSLLGPILNPKYMTEKMVHEQFIGTSQVSFCDLKAFIELCLARNQLAFNLDQLKLRSICWSQCKMWYLQALPFELPGGDVPRDLHHALFWLWCIFNKIAEADTYPPNADYEEIELLLRKLFSSIGILWEEFDDNISTSSFSLSMQTANLYDQISLLSSSVKSNCCKNVRTFEEEQAPGAEPPTFVTETLMVTFKQFLSILADMLGSEVVLSPLFGRAVRQIYLSEVDEIIKTGWMTLKKPGTDMWKRRWVVLHRNDLEFYSDPLCDSMKYQIVLSHKMRIESLPDTSSHKYRFRLVEHEGDFNIAWEAEMSCTDAQRANSWMLVINLSIKIHPTGLSTKQIELAERRLERHRRKENELSAIEKKWEVKKTQKKLQDVRECWNLMQSKLTERAEARNKAMEIMQKMDDIYDRLQTITKKQSLIRKASFRIQSAFPNLSGDSGVEMMEDEKSLWKTKSNKLDEQREKILKFEEEKRILQERLLELQGTEILPMDSDKTLVMVYGPEKVVDFDSRDQHRLEASSIVTINHAARKTQKTYTAANRSLYLKSSVPSISVSVFHDRPHSTSCRNSPVKLHAPLSQSHPELRKEEFSLENYANSVPGAEDNKLVTDSDLSTVSGERPK